MSNKVVKSDAVEVVADNVKTTEKAVKGSPKKKLQKKSASKAGSSSIQRHKTTLALILNAIKCLDNGKGSSLIAIKKFIKGQDPKYDLQRNQTLILRFVKKGIADGVLQTKARGVAGRFKIVSGKSRKKQNGVAPKPSNKSDPSAPRAVEKKSAAKIVKGVASPQKNKKGKRANEDVVGEVVAKKKNVVEKAVAAGASKKSTASKGKSPVKSPGKKLEKNRKSLTVPKSKPKMKTTKGGIGAKKKVASTK